MHVNPHSNLGAMRLRAICPRLESSVNRGQSYGPLALPVITSQAKYALLNVYKCNTACLLRKL